MTCVLQSNLKSEVVFPASCLMSEKFTFQVCDLSLRSVWLSWEPGLFLCVTAAVSSSRLTSWQAGLIWRGLLPCGHPSLRWGCCALFNSVDPQQEAKRNQEKRWRREDGENAGEPELSAVGLIWNLQKGLRLYHLVPHRAPPDCICFWILSQFSFYMNCRFLIFLIILGIAQTGREPFILTGAISQAALVFPRVEATVLTDKHVWKSMVNVQSSQ